MQLKKITIILVLVVGFITSAQAQKVQVVNQDTIDGSPTNYDYFIRTSYYSFTNWYRVGIIPNIYFYELHAGKQIDSKNKVGVKLARVKLFQPLGIQHADLDLNSNSEWFTGRIEEYGAGAFYQRNLWKGLYASVEVMPFLKVFLGEEDRKLGNGFRLYTSYHVGYHIPLFNNRFFIEPQIHSQYWPINSKGPNGFRSQVEKHDNYFLFEPNIYLGFKFN
jgi:hypothetical protein